MADISKSVNGSISNVSFQNKFVENLPGDLSKDLSTRETPQVLYSLVKPTQVQNPRWICWNQELAQDLGMVDPLSSTDLKILSGSEIHNSMKPYSARYGGHQFGNWAGQLGDGRAITLGEIYLPPKIYELQLKGAGLTPYSRRGDGRAVLRSSLREYLMSEAMHYLGAPSTRALSLVSTGEKVLRDPFYDGRPIMEPGAIVCRVAPTFLRFGNFQILSMKKEFSELRLLVNWTIENHFKNINPKNPQKISLMFNQICEDTAKLIVQWCRVGFVHGVMNTDNMSVLGLTLDYGPFAIMENYDPEFTPNTTDLPGRRYAFGRQPLVALWNLEKLAESLAVLVEDKETLNLGLQIFDETFIKLYREMIANKIGLVDLTESEFEIVKSLDQIMQKYQLDYNLFYANLTDIKQSFVDTFYFKRLKINDLNQLDLEKLKSEIDFMSQEFLQFFNTARDLLFKSSYLNLSSAEDFENWILNILKQWQLPRHLLALEKMKSANPYFVLRNFLIFETINELELQIEDVQKILKDRGVDEMNSEADFIKSQKLENLIKALKQPYQKIKGMDDLYMKRPSWAEKERGCYQLSCSS